MKILLVNKFHYLKGGSESYYFELGKILKEYGHEVVYFSMKDDKNINTGEKEYFVDSVDTSGKNIMNALNVIYSKASRKEMKKILTNFEPDVIHLNNFNFQITPSILIEIKKWKRKYHKKCKIIYTSHDYQLVCPNHRLFIPSKNKTCKKCIGGKYLNCLVNKCIYNSILKSVIGGIESYYWHKKKIYDLIDTVICPSKFIKDIIDSDKTLDVNTTIIPNFIEMNDNMLHSKEKLPQKYILYFGRYSLEKGINSLLEVCRKHNDINFVFVGDGPLVDEINEISNILNLGFKKKEELNYIIKNAFFSVCCSKWYEIFGLTNGESVFLGTPVIGPNIGGIPEVIDDNVNALLYDPNNDMELEKLIVKLWNDKNLHKKLVNGCKETKYLNLQEYTKLLLKLYESGDYKC